MRRQIATNLCSAAVCSAFLCAVIFTLAASTLLATAQPKTAKACREEWRAGKAANQTSGLTEKAYLAQCRAGGTLDQSAAAADTPAGSATTNANRQFHTSIKDIMEAIIDPSADALWGAVGTVVDKDGIHDAVPKTPEEWGEVRRAALRLIEGTNLLLLPGREAAPPGTKSETPGVELEPAQIAELVNKNRNQFNGFAKALHGLAVEAMRASEEKKEESVLEIGGRMESVCEGCHQTFWYPPQKPATAHK